MGAPSPEGLLPPRLPLLPTPPAALSLTLSPLSKVKRIVTHLLCVCLNKIYIVLSFLFSFFHVSSLILHIEAPWRGPAAPFPQAGWNVGSCLGRKLGREGWLRSWETGHGAQARCGPSWLRLALWLVFGAVLGSPTPCYPPATSTGQTTSGARPRILGQGTCLSWAHLPLSTLPLPPPMPRPSPPGLRGVRRSEVRGSTQVQLPGGTASLMRQEGGCPHRRWAAAGGPGSGR